MGLYFGTPFDGNVLQVILMSPRKTFRKPSTLRTAEVAEILGISERTLRRRLATGSLPEPPRDSTNNYRIWTPDDIQALNQILQREHA